MGLSIPLLEALKLRTTDRGKIIKKLIIDNLLICDTRKPMDMVWRWLKISPPALPLVRTTSSKCVTSESYHVVVITTIRVNNMTTTGQQRTWEGSVRAPLVWRSWKAWWICATSYRIRLPFPYDCIRYTYWNWNPGNRIVFAAVT
jgi:hypothetical protein